MNLIAACAHIHWSKDSFYINNQLNYVLAGGDDYELAFTAPTAARDGVQAAALASQTRVTCVGQVEAEPGIRLRDAQGQPVSGDFGSFDHFA